MLKKIFVFLGLALFGCSTYAGPSVTINDLFFRVQIADSLDEQMQGLMFVEHMSRDEGMFFVYDHSRELSFWMKNTLIPLDIIYIDEDFKIVSIAKNVQPCVNDQCEVYESDGKAKYVLEINGGLSEEYGFEKGVTIDYDSNLN